MLTFFKGLNAVSGCTHNLHKKDTKNLRGISFRPRNKIRGISTKTKKNVIHRKGNVQMVQVSVLMPRILKDDFRGRK